MNISKALSLAVTYLAILLATGCQLWTDASVAPVSVTGQWVTTESNALFEDPQTSGLVSWRGKLLTVSDRSALDHHQLHIHQLDFNGQLQRSMPIIFSDRINQSCFGEYITDSPDLEAMVVMPNDDNELIIVTEDASSKTLSPTCAERFGNTGSTPYPTLLLRLVLQDTGVWLMSHVRPLQFAQTMGLANYPNDGFEGLAFGAENTLYLALEKDSEGQPRIFSVEINSAFWDTPEFAPVKDPQLATPRFTEGNHPINGMTYVVDQRNGQEWLIAAARNDDELWLIDPNKNKQTQIIPINYYANPTPENRKCVPTQPMTTAGIEGVAVVNSDLWLINDPWKKNYPLNIQCAQDSSGFNGFSPLLFRIPLEKIIRE